MIPAISNTGTLRFRVFQERFTARVFIAFMRRPPVTPASPTPIY
jgi:hypothetical protein